MKRLLRCVWGTEDMSTVFEVRDNSDRREQLVKRKSTQTVTGQAIKRCRRNIRG